MVSSAAVSPVMVLPLTVSLAAVSPVTDLSLTVSSAAVSPVTDLPLMVSSAAVSPVMVLPLTVSSAAISPVTDLPLTVSSAAVLILISSRFSGVNMSFFPLNLPPTLSSINKITFNFSNIFNPLGIHALLNPLYLAIVSV